MNIQLAALICMLLVLAIVRAQPVPQRVDDSPGFDDSANRRFDDDSVNRNFDASRSRRFEDFNDRRLDDSRGRVNRQFQSVANRAQRRFDDSFTRRQSSRSNFDDDSSFSGDESGDDDGFESD